MNKHNCTLGVLVKALLSLWGRLNLVIEIFLFVSLIQSLVTNRSRSLDLGCSVLNVNIASIWITYFKLFFKEVLRYSCHFFLVRNENISGKNILCRSYRVIYSCWYFFCILELTVNMKWLTMVAASATISAFFIRTSEGNIQFHT